MHISHLLKELYHLFAYKYLTKEIIDLIGRKVNERSQIRASILRQLNKSYDDEEKFESIINKLILHEENFIQNVEDTDN